MGQIYNKDFSAGWTPSDDSINGRPNGSLQFSNLTLDDNGAVVLAKGTSKVNLNPLPGDVNAIYSRVINGVKHRYVGILNSNIVKDTGGGSFGTTVLIDTSSEKAAFGTAFGQIFACKGTQRKKDNGSIINNLGISAPTNQVTITYPTPPTVDVSGYTPPDYHFWENVESSLFNNTNGWVNFDTDLATFRGIAQVKYGGGTSIDTTALSGGSVGEDTDTLFFDINISDSSKLTKVRLEFYLTYPGTGGAGNPAAKDYFFFEWLNDDQTPFKEGLYQQTTLNTGRGDFTKVGDIPSLNWKSIACMRLVVEADSVISVAANNFVFQGGSKGPLNGSPEYVQVNVNNTGSYQAASAYGPITTEILDLHGTYLNITPYTAGMDSQVNTIWIYRRGGGLERFYRVKTLTSPYSTFSDQLSDEDAILLNEILDERLISVQQIPDAIRGIEGPIGSRVLYMTYKEIYMSLVGNPDTCNSASTLLTAGAISEVNLFLTKVSNASILLGTTQDIYEISGSFQDLPDGFVDVTIRALGLSKPPISDAFVNHDGSLIYMAEDGWRLLTGNSSNLLVSNIDLLYRGQTRYGTVGVNILAQNNIQFSACISKNRLFTSQFLLDGSSTIFVYDFFRQYWRKYNIAANQLFAEEDGTVLGGFYGGGNGFLKTLDTGNQIDGAIGIPFNLQTVFYNDNLPRNRKDSFTLKLKLDTGNTNVVVNLYKDESTTPISLGNVFGNGIQEKFINLNSLVGIAKSYQLEITGTVSTFRLEDWSIDYEARPTQLTYLRIPPSDYGVAGRKRIPEIPILIDTLGNSIRFTPSLDGAVQTTQTVTTNDRNVYNYQFSADASAYNIGGILDSVNGDVYFEFYNLIQPREIEVLPDPLKFKFIQDNNLGTFARKRIFAFAFIIDTRGSNVTFTPRVDGVNGTTSTVNTNRRQTYVHYFTAETYGTDIGGTLAGVNQFEYYGIDLAECVSEKLPAPTKFLVLPTTNFDIANKKRLRTIPLVINTNGNNVIYTPIVDGTSQATSTFNTTEKRTVFHYFTTDVFGVDLRGTLDGSGNSFEFYGILTPENVETLPVPKRFDQIGPVEFNKLGKLISMRIRLLPTGTTLPYAIFMGDTSLQSGTITVVANKEDVYEVLLNKSLSGTICRVEFGPTTNEFHRFDVELAVNLSGSQTEKKLIRVK